MTRRSQLQRLRYVIDDSGLPFLNQEKDELKGHNQSKILNSKYRPNAGSKFHLNHGNYFNLPTITNQ